MRRGWELLMKFDDQDHRLDQLLDIGLRKYADIEPRPGLEGRIVANLRAEQTRAFGPRWLPRVVAVAASLLIAATTWMALRTNTRKSVVAEDPAKTTARLPAAKVPARPERSANVSSIVTRPRQRSLPLKTRLREDVAAKATAKLEQFPSMRPLSPQEKMLLSYVRQTPREDLLYAVTPTASISDLRVKKLEIAPLDVDAAPDVQERN